MVVDCGWHFRAGSGLCGDGVSMGGGYGRDKPLLLASLDSWM